MGGARRLASRPGGNVANRLARESSPYLLLHAENPVDWYPWGEEAFARARAEQKPIFLSIGYSTCYWCHVMERESFSDPALAREMNDGFVCVKVDREERPDVDEIYMTATQLITRSGGWPNSVFLTPDLKPFFAGTYFPPRDTNGRPGFARVLQSLRQSWLFRRPEVLQQADVVAQAMEQALATQRAAGSALPAGDVASELQRSLASRFDRDWGGFSPAPKFPSPANLFFLLGRATQDEAREMLVTTLDRMARGGLQDHLAGGFHRYSTDDEWLVPHFEKMLYDNASLAWLYAEASALAPEQGFAEVARRTLDFVLHEMTGEHGAFLSAIDAETDGHEGAYYTWTAEELDQALSGPDGELFMNVYGIEGAPPFEGERYVLHLPVPLAEAARTGGIAEAELRRRLERGRRALLEARNRRQRPLTDDKVLADWNGLMIGALARAGARLAEPRYIVAARQAAAFVLEALAGEDGTLMHAWRDGRASVPAFLDDYAFLVEGLLQLFAATGEEAWAEEAARLVEEQEGRLADVEGGGYFGAGADERLLFRTKPGFDGPVASGNGIAALNLVELARLTGDGTYAERALRTLVAFAAGIEQVPLAHVTLVRALEAFRELDRSLLSAPRPPEAEVAPAPAEGAAAPAPAASAAPAPSLEDEAYEALEVEASLGRSDDEEWKPFRLELAFRRGWHANANSAGPGLMPTKVSGVLGRLRNVRYPEGQPWDGGGGPVPVYAGRVVIEGEIEHRGGGAPAVEVEYQACDESRCLPSVTRIVRLR
jgi:uncharacterized protein YyaL (SSP411 family)